MTNRTLSGQKRANLARFCVRAAAAAAALAAATVAPAAGIAQTIDPGPRANFAPTLDTSTDAMQSNPANLAFGPNWQASVLLSNPVSDDFTSRTSYNLGMSATFFETLALGVANSHYSLQSPYGATSLTAAAQAGGLAFGITRHNYHSRTSVVLGEYGRTDLGVTLRIPQHFAISYAAENVTEGLFVGLPTVRVHSLGAGLRTRHDELGLDFGVQLSDAFASPQFSLHLRGRINAGGAFFAETRLMSDESPYVGAGLSWTIGGGTTMAGLQVDEDGNATALLGFSIRDEPHRNAVSTAMQRGSLARFDLSGELTNAPAMGLFSRADTGFDDMLWSLHQLARSGDAGGVYLHVGGLSIGPGQLAELVDALQSVRDAGMPIVVYLADLNLRGLAIARIADLVYAAPTASLLETGVGTSRTYLAQLLDNLGVEAQFVRIGDYKSGPERFTENGPNAPGLERITTYVDQFRDWLHDHLGDPLGDGSVGSVDWAETLAAPPLSALELVDMGIINAVAYEDEVAGLIRADRVDVPTSVVSGYPGVAVDDHLWAPRHRVAVLHIDGTIGGSNLLSPSTGTTSDDVEGWVDAIITGGGYDAAVVRIDSPGGSAVASDEIHHALSRLAVAVPTVVSMGDVAASGGYYAAAIDAPVFASATTLTGSIGIYAGTFAFDSLFDALGVTQVAIGDGVRPQYFDGSAWSEDDESAVMSYITDAYGLFLDRVATGRGMTIDEADAVGQGRIWSGADAQEVGLVDHLGGFVDAVNFIALQEDLHGDGIQLEHFSPTPTLFARAGIVGSSEALLSTVIELLGDSPIVAFLPALMNESGTPMAMLEWAEIW